MNTGIFGEGFPYSNFHDLNMDWIIKIAKDFLDQYTHIQEIIEQGKTDIQDLTTSGLEQLQDKADNLTELLQAWYDEHSEDIANQLADALADLNAWYTEHSEDISNQLTEALADLNEWYTTHENYLDQTLADNTTEFNQRATQKAYETIQTIPSDYTDLSNNVLGLDYIAKSEKEVNDNLYASGIEGLTELSNIELTTGYYLDNTGLPYAHATGAYSEYIKVIPGEEYVINAYDYSANQKSVCYYDYELNFVSGLNLGQYSNEITIPANIFYMRCSCINGKLVIFRKENKSVKESIRKLNNIISKNVETKDITDKVVAEGTFGQFLNGSGVIAGTAQQEQSNLFLSKKIDLTENPEVIGYKFTATQKWNNCLGKLMNSKNENVIIIRGTNNEITSFNILLSDYPTARYMYLCTEDYPSFTVEEIKLSKTVNNPTEEIVNLEWENATGFYNRYGVLDPLSGVKTASVRVIEHETYYITSRNYYQVPCLLFFDSTGTFVSSLYLVGNDSPITHHKVTVPENAFTMLLQQVDNYPTTLTIQSGTSGVRSILKGKRITVIGDSITEKNHTAHTNWVDYIQDWTDSIIQNLGASGTGFVAGNSYVNRITHIIAPDIIGIAMSFNDMGSSDSDYRTAVETFFDTLLTSYPSTPIICYIQSPWSNYHYGETSDAKVEILRDVCGTKGIPFYDDLYKGGTLKPWLQGNRNIYYMNDGEGSTGAEDWVHPNSEGHKAIARYLYPHFAENIVETGLDY